MKNPAASALGKLAKGKKKTMTEAALQARRENGRKSQGRPRKPSAGGEPGDRQEELREG